jgi:hypothetical protein
LISRFYEFFDGLEAFFADTSDTAEVFYIPERTVFIPVGDYRPREFGADAGQRGKLFGIGSVDVDLLGLWVSLVSLVSLRAFGI